FMLRRTLISGADVELVMVGQVVRDAGIGEARRSEAEVRDMLGPRFLDVFYRVTGPGGKPEAESGALRGRHLPLSAQARERPRCGRWRRCHARPVGSAPRISRGVCRSGERPTSWITWPRP